MSDPVVLPANPFYATPQQRVALARQRFFEDGVRPSGIVSEAVIQSWTRCLRSRQNPREQATFEPVTAGRVQTVLRSNCALLEAAADELKRLQTTLAGTSSTAMLTDAHGVVVGTTFSRGRTHEVVMPISARIGVNLAEEAVGTTAPGITARSGQACLVLGSEHFFGNVQLMQCAAAPIRDVRGRLAGVLDLSSEGLPFGFDAAAVVGHYAAEIENRLLCAQSTEHLVVRLQIAPGLLDTPLAGLVGITGDGRIDWANGAATRLLGLPASLPRRGGPLAEDGFGVPLAALADLAQHGGAQPLPLPNGLTLWLRCEWRARDGKRRLHGPVGAVPQTAAASVPLAEPAPAPAAPVEPVARAATLRQTEREAVTRALAECGGNVSKAARLLGVSRGLIYRTLKATAEG